MQGPSIFNIVRGNVDPLEGARVYGINLKQKGEKYEGLCPFHNEKTPSFGIYNGRLNCFGCGFRGDIIDVVAKLTGVEPLAAAKDVARRFNLPVHTRDMSREDRRKLEEAFRIREIDRQHRAEIEAAWRVIALLHRVCFRLRGYKNMVENTELVHLEPYFAYLLEGMACKDKETQVAALKEAGKWIKP